MAITPLLPGQPHSPVVDTGNPRIQLEEEEMLKKTIMGVAISALAVAAFQSQASAGGGHHSRIFEILDEIGSESDYEPGPSCDWIAKQARKVGTSYWRNRYNEECSGNDDEGDDD